MSNALLDGAQNGRVFRFVAYLACHVDSMEHNSVMTPQALRELASMVIKPGVKISPQVQEVRRCLQVLTYIAQLAL